MTSSAQMYSWMKSRQRQRLKTRNRVFAVIACSFVTWWGFVLFYIVSQITTTGGLSHLLEKPVLDGAPPVLGTYARFVDNTTEVVYSLPLDKTHKGVALILHACTHSALKFFSPSASCEECVGLSEELRISRTLLQLGYSVLAVTSLNRKSGCWAGPDLPKLKAALGEFQQLLPEDSATPVIAIGASSGGHFAANVAEQGVAQAALIMVMSIGPDLRNKLLEKKERMPPIYLAPMPRDKGTTSKAKSDYEEMKSVDASSKVIFDDSTCGSLPVTAEYLNERVPNMKRSMADSIVKALLEAGHLDANFYFTKDPTQSNWRDSLRSACGSVCLEHQSLAPGQSPLAKALHRAWAFHEYCSEVVPAALEYFEKSIVS